MESSALNLRTKSLRLVAAVALAVLGIALLLVHGSSYVADDPLLARQIGWNLLFIGLSAGILAAGAAWLGGAADHPPPAAAGRRPCPRWRGRASSRATSRPPAAAARSG